MRRNLFNKEHELFREMVRSFIAKEVEPYHRAWEHAGLVSRELWLAAGRAGLLGIEMDDKYGGGGNDDYRYYVIIGEELARSGAHGPAFAVHNDINGSYLKKLTTEEQKDRWLPGYCSGELITAIAMSEPAAGSDMSGIRTTARDAGDHYTLNGQKTFISNGQICDLMIVLAKTDPDAGYLGFSLVVVEAGMEGFQRGKNLEKIGMHAQDTSELFFTDVRVPKSNLLGHRGMGLMYLMRNLPRERLAIGVGALAVAEQTFDDTLKYCKQRNAFGMPIGKFQHNQFVLAEMATEISVARVFTDRCIVEHNAGRLTAEEASMAKWWNTELCKRVVDRCVQLHGGYGCMLEYPVARTFLDSRILTIFGGTTEIMKEIIGSGLGL